MQTLLLIIIFVLLGCLCTLILLHFCDNIITRIMVKSMALSDIEKQIDYYNKKISETPIDNIKKIETLLDLKDLYEYYLKIKKKQLGI